MTEDRQSSRGRSMLHSMLNRLKSSERPQSSSHVTAQHRRHSNDANQSDIVFFPESDKPEWNFAGFSPSECSVKPEGNNDADADTEYFMQRIVPHESSPTSNPFPKSEQSSNSLNDLLRNARQDLKPSKCNATGKEVTEGQTSQVESHFSILQNSPGNGSFTPDLTRSSVSNSEPRYVNGTMEHRRSENTVSHVSFYSALHLLHSS